MLSSSDVEQYRRDGYLLVRDVVAEQDIAALRHQAEAWVEASRDVEVNGDVFDLEPGHSRTDPRVRRIKNPPAHSPAYDRVMRSDAIVDLVAQLIGPDVRFQGPKLNMKSAGFGSPVEWHQDWAFYPHTNDDLLAVGVVIDDMTLDNGCLLVVPGSHKGPVLDHHSNGYFVGSVDPASVDESSSVALEAPAGSVTIHHARLLHGSAPNTSGMPRRLFLIAYASGDAWPLVGNIAWDELQSRQLRGLTGPAPRMEPVPVRLPLPVVEPSDSIYELQSTEPVRRSRFAAAGHARG